MSHEQVYINIDSAERDQFHATTPAQYVYRLPATLRNVARIELMMFQMTRAEPNLSSGMLDFQLVRSGSAATCTLPEGEVPDGASLAALVQAALRTAPGASSFAATFDATRHRLSISGAGPFSLVVTSRLARVLGVLGDGERGGGIVVAQQVAGGAYQINGTRAVDLAGEPYILMYVNDFDRNTGATAAIQNSYIMVPLENRLFMQRFIMCNDEKEKKGTYHLTGNQTSISDLRIRFTRPDGSPYDFQGIDHQIVFKVTRCGNKDYQT
jgi:hypothetical protein